MPEPTIPLKADTTHLNQALIVSHPNFIKLPIHLQREQSLQEATLVKWETGETSKTSKHSEARNARNLKLVEDYHKREILQFLKGIALNFEF